MEAYKEMYFKLMAAQTDVLEALQAIVEQLLQAHRQAEQLLTGADEGMQTPQELKAYKSFRSLN